MSTAPRRRAVARWTAALTATLLLSACGSSGQDGPATTTAMDSPSPAEQPAPSTIGRPNPFVPGSVEVTGAGVDGTEATWTVTVDAADWVWADAVHGDLSDGWIVSAEVYLAADVEYTAVSGTMIYSTADWSFTGTDGGEGILGEAGGGGAEEGSGLPVAGELAEGESVRGRVYLGLAQASAGTLAYTTLGEGEQGTWSVPTQ